MTIVNGTSLLDAAESSDAGSGAVERAVVSSVGESSVSSRTLDGRRGIVISALKRLWEAMDLTGLHHRSPTSLTFMATTPMCSATMLPAI